MYSRNVCANRCSVILIEKNEYVGMKRALTIMVGFIWALFIQSSKKIFSQEH